MKFKRILLADDHQILVDGIRNMLPENEYEYIESASNGKEALDIIKTRMIDVLITDIRMPEMTGQELIKEVRKHSPQTKIIVLSMAEDKSTVLECVDLGVDAYITKNISKDDLFRALKQLEKNKFYLSDELAGILVEKVNHLKEDSLLTPREKEVLTLVVDEKTNKQIAGMLFVSERTVESHRRNIYRKTGQESLVGLIKYALENSII